MCKLTLIYSGGTECSDDGTSQPDVFYIREGEEHAVLMYIYLYYSCDRVKFLLRYVLEPMF